MAEPNQEQKPTEQTQSFPSASEQEKEQGAPPAQETQQPSAQVPSRWQLRPPSEEELLQALTPKLGEQVARQLIAFIKIASERMPTVTEVIDTYQLLVPVIGKKAAQKLVDFVTEIARWKHGSRLL
ncbi:MAG: hypothetical protein C4295_07855 [Candidatus Fervidibacterota bacterium]